MTDDTKKEPVTPPVKPPPYEARLLRAAAKQLRSQREWCLSETQPKWTVGPAVFALAEMADACDRAAEREGRKR